MSLIVRYYYNGAIHESFLCFQAAESLDAAGLSKMIVNSLEKHGLDHRKQPCETRIRWCVSHEQETFWCIRILSDARFAFYVHFNAHCLNLVLVDATKAVPDVDFFSLVQQLYTFVSGS